MWPPNIISQLLWDVSSQFSLPNSMGHDPPILFNNYCGTWIPTNVSIILLAKYHGMWSPNNIWQVSWDVIPHYCSNYTPFQIAWDMIPQYYLTSTVGREPPLLFANYYLLFAVGRELPLLFSYWCFSQNNLNIYHLNSMLMLLTHNILIKHKYFNGSFSNHNFHNLNSTSSIQLNSIKTNINSYLSFKTQ
jgi:hypothetical protein